LILYVSMDHIILLFFKRIWSNLIQQIKKIWLVIDHTVTDHESIRVKRMIYTYITKILLLNSRHEWIRVKHKIYIYITNVSLLKVENAFQWKCKSSIVVYIYINCMKSSWRQRPPHLLCEEVLLQLNQWRAVYRRKRPQLNSWPKVHVNKEQQTLNHKWEST
jgi:hypothetical protein